MTTSDTPAPTAGPETHQGHPGRPRVGEGIELRGVRVPTAFRDLIVRYQRDMGYTKIADTIRTLMKAGLWAEGYDEVRDVRVVYAAGEPEIDLAEDAAKDE